MGKKTKIVHGYGDDDDCIDEAKKAKKDGCKKKKFKHT